MGPSPVVAAAVPRDPRRPILTIAAAIATPIVLVALAIVPFVSPIWIHAGQERARADAWTGWPMSTVETVTNGVLHDLVLGPPAFDQVVDGVPVFDQGERAHFQDVRNVGIGFAAIALVAGVVLLGALVVGRGGTRAWRGVSIGAMVTGVGVVALGIFSVIAFDTAFEIMHRLLFAAGTYTFDPATERMVQLFPESFWYETAVALGVLILALAIASGLLAAWRIRAIERRLVTAATDATPATQATTAGTAS